MPRISLIHALRVSIDPIEQAFARLWPEAQVFNLLDDALSHDLAQAGSLTPAMRERFVRLSAYCADCGADAILFTCSAFGEAIDEVKRSLEIPVLKPNEAALEEALARGPRLAVLATFAPTLTSMIPEIEALASARGLTPEVRPVHVEGALAALQRGEAETHDALIAAAAIEDCDALLLAQFSMARAAPEVRTRTTLPVVTTPESAVTKLKALLTT